VDDDWRLTGQGAYLKGVTLVRKPYRATSDAWEHDHCVFCWAKFVDPGFSGAHAAIARADPAVQTEGYAAVGTAPQGQDDYHWVCAACFIGARLAWSASP
jgi:hypothetical protein